MRRTFTHLLVNSDLRRVRNHGLCNINGYRNTFEQDHANSQADIRLVQQNAATAALDDDPTLSYLPGVLVAALAVEKAKSAGGRMVLT